MTNEMKVLRMNLLGGMNAYVLELGDEELYDTWFAIGVPDEATEEDLESIALDDDEFTSVCSTFARLVKISTGFQSVFRK